VSAEAYLDRAITLLRDIRETQMASIKEAGRLCSTALKGGGLIHVFGTGHSQSSAVNELVVVTTSQAWNNALVPKQKDLVNALLQTGRPLIVVAVREPYDIACFTAEPTYLAIYGFNPVSLRALVRVLFGEVNPSGKLPVTIPAADDPGRVLFPYGFGLSYDC